MTTTAEGKVKTEVKKELFHRRFIRAGAPENDWPHNPQGWYYMPVPSGMGVNGITDFVGFETVTVTPGMVGQQLPVALFIETKAQGKRENLSPNQKQRSKEIQAAGGKVIVVENVEQLKVLMR